MDRWLAEDGRPMLFEALGDAWGRLEEGFQHVHRTEAVKTAEIRSELEALKARVASVDRLEQQNKALREELDQLSKLNQKQASLTKSRERTPLASLPVNEAQNSRKSNQLGRSGCLDSDHAESVADYSKLEERYSRLRNQYDESIAANAQLKVKCREKTRAYEKWVKHANILQDQVNARNRKIEKLKALLAASTASGLVPSPSFASDTTTASAGNARGSSAKRDADKSVGVGVASPLWPPEGPAQVEQSSSSSSLAETESTASLHPAPDGQQPVPEHKPVKEEPLSDGDVVVVSERSVRKRRQNDDSHLQTPATTRVKVEDGSDPVMTSEQHRFMPHESVDFDKIEEIVTTPRRLRVDRTTLVQEISLPGPLLSPGGQGFSVAEVGDCQPEDLSNDLDPTDELAQDDLDHEKRSSRSSALFVPGDVKFAQLPSVKNSRSSAGLFQPSVTSSLRHRIASLAEDGDEARRVIYSPARQHASTGRLENLLNTTSSERQDIFAKAARVLGHKPTYHDRLHMPVPPRRELPFDKQVRPKSSNALRGLNTPTSHPGRPASASKPKSSDSSDASSSGRPLRQTPSSKLHRTDFKVNPKFNDGYDFAYGDVIRGKERACLPGCTKESCCGKVFRPIALGERVKTGKLAFQALLENYLGEEAYKLAALSPEEKENLWVDAKVKDLANKFGRHRQRYNSMQEPPGWSRMDMPSTQEELEDREIAKKMERADIEERYREALRRGRWLFRDEDP